MAKNERLRDVLEKIFQDTPHLAASQEMVVYIQSIAHDMELPISQSTAYRWINLYKTQGHLKRKKATGRPTKPESQLKKSLIRLLLVKICEDQLWRDPRSKN